MPRKCCVLGCTSNYRTDIEKYVTVYLFPKDPHRRQQWLRAIHRDNYEPGATAVVCIKHFSENHLVRENTATRSDGSVLVVPRKIPKLTEDACPSVFPNLPSFLSLERTPKRKDPRKRRGKILERDSAAFRSKRTSKMEETVSVKSEPVWPYENSSLEGQLKGEYELEPHVWVKQEVLVKEEVQDTASEETDEYHPSYSESNLVIEEALEIVKDEVEDSYEFSDVKSDFFLDEVQSPSGSVTKQGCPYSEEYSQEYAFPAEHNYSLSSPPCATTNFYKCDLCPNTFSRRAYLNKHIRIRHGNERKFYCSLCSKCYKLPGNLKRHMVHVHEDEKFRCPQRSNRLKSQSGLKKHLDGHRKERNYKRRHVHARKKCYQCNLCLEEFFDKTQMISHRNEHPGKQGYKCTVCQKELNSQNALVNHMSKAHSEKKNFQCTCCFKTFVYFGSLLTHTKSNHQFMTSDA